MLSLHYDNNDQLMLENVAVADLAAAHPTPFYAYSTNEIKRNCQLVNSIGAGYDLHPCYALKANYNPVLIRLIHQIGRASCRERV